MDSLESALWSVLHARTLLLGAIAFLFFAFVFRKRRPKNCPPGPPRMPFLGNLLQMDFQKPHLQMQQLVKKYGKVVSMEFGDLYSVILTGLPLIKEALVHQDQHFIDRPVTAIRKRVFKKHGILPASEVDRMYTHRFLLVSARSQKDAEAIFGHAVSNCLRLDFISVPTGVIMSNGQTWKEQRRFTLTTLRNFGLGKKSLEERIQEEAYYLVQFIKEEKGQPFDPHFKINNAVSNIICSVTFGERFGYQDEKFQELLMLFDKAICLETSAWCQFCDAFPIIIDFLPGPHRTLFKCWGKLKLFVAQVIENHRRDWNPDEIRDFIDAYLKEIEKHKEDTTSSFNKENLIYTTLDLFFAGTETTSTTLRWALLYMALYPDIQEKVHAEINRVIDPKQQPSMALRESMPYTHAVIHEVQRMGNIVPLNVPRAVTADTTLDGHLLPKGTMVLTNLTALHNDPAQWATPDTFNPEHFLENGQFKKREDFLPFSIGKRACLGEQLARTELFIFFISLMRNFTFRAPDNEQLTQKFRMGLTIAPVKYRICAVPRA